MTLRRFLHPHLNTAIFYAPSIHIAPSIHTEGIR
uniref:Uncharacterized protein n=1 Tax=Anguilla anguilla TaxID=7936 RepID=A0A0E9XZ24_ANGAN